MGGLRCHCRDCFDTLAPPLALKAGCDTPYPEFLCMHERKTYYFVAASRKFLFEDEPLDESLKERVRNYRDRGKEIDFWAIEQPAFLEAPEMAEVKRRCPQPAAAVISTDPLLIRWLTLRLEFVATGQFEAPSETIPDPFASLAVAG